MERIKSGMVLKKATMMRYIQPVVFFPASSLALRFKLLHILGDVKDVERRRSSDRLTRSLGFGANMTSVPFGLLSLSRLATIWA